jgi:hypothetical protein
MLSKDLAVKREYLAERFFLKRDPRRLPLPHRFQGNLLDFERHCVPAFLNTAWIPPLGFCLSFGLL